MAYDEYERIMNEEMATGQVEATQELTIRRNNGSERKIWTMQGPGSIEAFNVAASAQAQVEIANALYLVVNRLTTIAETMREIDQTSKQ